jgi:hypothetical protein
VLLDGFQVRHRQGRRPAGARAIRQGREPGGQERFDVLADRLLVAAQIRRDLRHAPVQVRQPDHLQAVAHAWRDHPRAGTTAQLLPLLGRELDAKSSRDGRTPSCHRFYDTFLTSGLAPGASTPSGRVGCIEMRLVLSGEVEYAGKRCPAVSRLYFPPDVPFDEMTSQSGAEVLVFQVAVPGGEPPPLNVV